jgi:hypothetical protein
LSRTYVIFGECIKALLHVGVLGHPIAANLGEVGLQDAGIFLDEGLQLQLLDDRLVIFRHSLSLHSSEAWLPWRDLSGLCPDKAFRAVNCAVFSLGIAYSWRYKCPPLIPP